MVSENIRSAQSQVQRARASLEQQKRLAQERETQIKQSKDIVSKAETQTKSFEKTIPKVTTQRALRERTGLLGRQFRRKVTEVRGMVGRRLGEIGSAKKQLKEAETELTKARGELKSYESQVVRAEGQIARAIKEQSAFEEAKRLVATGKPAFGRSSLVQKYWKEIRAGKKRAIELAQKDIGVSERIIFDPSTLDIKGIESKTLGKTLSPEEFNRMAREQAEQIKKLELEQKKFKDLDVGFSKIPVKEEPSIVIKGLKKLKQIGVLGVSIPGVDKFIVEKAKKVPEFIKKGFAKIDEKQLDIKPKIIEVPVPQRVTIGAEPVTPKMQVQEFTALGGTLGLISAPLETGFEAARLAGRGVEVTTRFVDKPRTIKAFGREFPTGITDERFVTIPTPERLGRAVELGGQFLVIGAAPTAVTSLGFIGTGTKKALDPTLPFEQRLLGVGEAGVGAGIGTFAGARFLKTPITKKIPTRPLKTPQAIEEQAIVQLGDKQVRVSRFIIKGEKKPPIRVEETTRVRDILGLKPKKVKVEPAKLFEIKTTRPVIGEGPILVQERVLTPFATARTSLRLEGMGGRVNLAKEFRALDKPTQRSFQKLAEKKVGRPVSLENVPKVLKEDQTFISFITTTRQFRVTPSTGRAIAFLPGRRITRAVAVSETKLLGETEVAKIIGARTFFKDVTKPFARARGKVPELETVIVQYKEPFILDTGLGVTKFRGAPKTELTEKFGEFSEAIAKQVGEIKQAPVSKLITRPTPKVLPSIKPTVPKTIVKVKPTKAKLAPAIVPVIEKVKAEEKVKVEEIPKSILDVKSKQLQIQKEKQLPKQVEIQKIVPKLKQLPQFKTLERAKQIELVKTITKVVAKPSLKAPSQITGPARPRPRPRPKPKPTPTPILKPSPGIITEIKKKVKPKVSKKAYNVFVKRGGKYIKISKKPLPKGKAEQLGVKRTITTLAATFQLREKGTTKEKDIKYKTPTKQFRKPKSGEKLTYVERKNLRLKKGSQETKEILKGRGTRGKKKKGRKKLKFF